MTTPAGLPTHLLPNLPTSAIPIAAPSAGPSSSQPQAASSRSAVPSFPPPAAFGPGLNAGNKKSNTIGMSLSTNVSDLLLSSLLPPNLPKLPTAPAQIGKKVGGASAPRELSTQREGLSLPLVSNNFRRFVTRVGPVFWLQDRMEEVLFWRKPIWTMAWMMTWTFVCFQPRVLLLLPSSVLILILLHIHERASPRTSLLGITIPPMTTTDRVDPVMAVTGGTTSAAPTGTGSTTSNSFTATTTKDSDGETVPVPAVPPKEAETGVDYYMNLQAIQNLMGLISDGYDYVAPKLAALQNPSPAASPLNLPLTPTHFILLLLPPTVLLPLTPAPLIPYLILPLGLAPPLAFHPNLTPALVSLPGHPLIRRIRAELEGWLLTDRLSDDIGRKLLGKVEVWENERLDPKVTSVASGTHPSTLPFGSWGAKFLRPSDRAPWVKVPAEGSRWKSTQDGLPSAAAGGEDAADAKAVLALQDGWDWVPGEDWRIDAAGLWSEAGVDAEGWVYSDDSWQNPASTPYTEAESIGDKPGAPGNTTNMPGLALRRVTRRRRWWRRVYEVVEVE
ncbi:hypothetical protein IAU60_001556 [Kwoniella sp. DSM 27419]